MARGPGYPFISLEQSVVLAKGLYDYSKRTPANLNAVLQEKWAYSPTSSSAVKMVAALKYFGLVELQTNGNSETIKITDRAYRILVDSSDSPERRQAMRDACLAPKAYKMCWDKWGVDLPPSMRSTLIFDEGFIDSTVDSFLMNYRKSLHFAGLLDDDANVKQNDAAHTNDKDEDFGVEVQSGGAASTQQMPSFTQAAPQPQHQIKVDPQSRVDAMPPKGLGMRQEVFTVTEGDVTIQWPERLSADSLQDFKDWLRILERKITRSALPPQSSTPASDNDQTQA